MVALTLGLAIMALYQGAAVQLVKLTGCAPELWAPALLYLRVRAIAMPASLVTMVAQSGVGEPRKWLPGLGRDGLALRLNMNRSIDYKEG